MLNDSQAAPSGAGAASACAAAIPTMTLKVFLDRAGAVLRDGLPADVWIEASVIACRPNQYGHSLELADAGREGATAARFQVFLPRSILSGMSGPSRLDPALLVGLTTLLRVAPQFSPRWGLQGRVLALSKETEASLERKRIERLRVDLKSEGLYERQRRLPPPRDVTRLAVIHPEGAAGHADIAAELSRWQAAGLIVTRSCAAAFDGDRAPAALVAALREAVRPLAGAAAVDLVVLVRGGGAKAGLGVLDDERVVRAVCLCPVPIVCGLGHAVDRGLVDEVAWTAVDTPSKVLDVVWRLMRQPATAAMAALAGIDAAARRHLTVAGQALELGYARCVTDAESQCRDAADDLGRIWTAVRVVLSAADQGCGRLRDEAGRLWRDVEFDAPACLARHNRRRRIGWARSPRRFTGA